MKTQFAALVLLGAGLASSIGTPHWLVETECEVFANQCTDVLVACTYVGIQGRLVVIPHWEPNKKTNCPQIALLPLQWPLWQ